MPNNSIPQPWLAFLTRIDESLDSEVQFHCFGAFAIMCLFGLPRPTEDVDILSALVRENYQKLFELAGKGSELHEKYRVYLDLVGGVAVVPDDYAERLRDITPSKFVNIRLLVMEPHDLVLTKVSRNYPHDIADVEYIARSTKLDVEVLRARFVAEVSHNVIGPPERTQGNLDFLIGMIKEMQS